jgi:hypothetical protein
MLRVGLISDTHGWVDPQVHEYFEECDEIWHAEDFGPIAVADELKTIAPLVGVYGNIDGFDVRAEYPQIMNFEREGVRVIMTHIGGTCRRYALTCRQILEEHPPDIFICGHSHILKIARDPDLENMIFLNPGAAGRHGFHKERTMVRFSLNSGKVFDMQVINLGPRTEKAEDVL